MTVHAGLDAFLVALLAAFHPALYPVAETASESGAGDGDNSKKPRLRTALTSGFVDAARMGASSTVVERVVFLPCTQDNAWNAPGLTAPAIVTGY